MGQLEGKIALVTGATSGMDAATAQVMADAGAAVVLAGRREAEVRASRREFGRGAARPCSSKRM